MAYEEETERGTENFRCVDPIQNFKIRVVLRSIKNRFVPLPYYDEEKPVSTSESSQNKESETEIEEYTFSWQEKAFSKSEIETYSKLSNCKTKIHEKYHEDVKKLSKNLNVCDKKLFTYVDADNYSLKNDDLNFVNGDKSYISSVSKQMSNLKVSGSTMRNYKNIPKTKIVNHSPNDKSLMQNHLINTLVQKMFLMAELEIKESSDEKKKKNREEYVLCVITYDQMNKVLKVSPSFSKETNAKPYSISCNKQHSSNAYHYWLYHASTKPSDDDINNEKRIRNEVHKHFLSVFNCCDATKTFENQEDISQHQNEVRKLKIGSKFSGQSPSHINVIILGEIISARDFDYDRVSVHYLANLPEGWHPADPETLAGVTHTARSNNSGVAHFSNLFTMELMFDLKHLEDFSAYLPEIFFEVLSTDRWKIYRNEGYTYVTLPRKPGIHNFDLRCWRASHNSVRSELDRFFLGGSQVIEDVSYVGSGSKLENKRITSRFGLKTIPSGSLQIKLNVIHQSEAFKLEKDKTRDGDVFGRFDTGNLLLTVNSVLEAFRQARERMIRAKERLQAEPD